MKSELELVTTGSELLNGGVVNRHAQWLGRQLGGIGWTLQRDTTVPDDAIAIRDAMVAALNRTDVVVVSGGLGPTSDDITRDVAAEWAGASVVMHEPTRQQILATYAARNKPLNDTVERHALVVEGAEVLTNNHGLAPGEHLCIKGKHLFLMPGPPREFQGVMRDQVLPWLVAQGVASTAGVHVFQSVGLGESDIAALLERAGYSSQDVATAYCAEPARVTIRLHEITGRAAEFQRAVTLVRTALGPAVYSEQDETIEQALARMLTASGQTVAVAESCTGGLIGQRLTAIPGSSTYLRGGVIAYHNDVKADVLGVPRSILQQHGAVSEPVAQAMAEGVRRIMGVNYGIAVTGIAGPDGGTTEKPVGLVYIAFAGAAGTKVNQLRLGGGREVIREASATMAMDLLRRQLPSP